MTVSFRHALVFVFPLLMGMSAHGSWLAFNSDEIRSTLSERPETLSMSERLLARPEQEKLDAARKLLSEKLAASPEDANVVSDSAALLLYTEGALSAEKALSMFAQVEERSPGLYSVALNRVAALELLGRLEEAMVWVEEARNRNRQPQTGTEWLQQLILQARLEQRTNSNWLETNSILGADFGTEVKPHWPRMADRETWAKRSRQALLYQLRDRLPFAKRPDPILADMIFDFANLQFLSGSPGSAIELYELAIAFGSAKHSIAEARLKALRDQAPAPPLSSRFNQTLLTILVGIALAGFLRLYLIRKKRTEQSEKTGE